MALSPCGELQRTSQKGEHMKMFPMVLEALALLAHYLALRPILTVSGKSLCRYLPLENFELEMARMDAPKA